MGLVDAAEFHFFHFFPYTDLPAGHEKHESLWVDFSNANYDPTVGHQLYNRYLSEMVLADRLGFQWLVAEVGLGRVGLVLGLEVSRLARNSSDWHHLLEICALTRTLILDENTRRVSSFAFSNAREL